MWWWFVMYVENGTKVQYKWYKQFGKYLLYNYVNTILGFYIK